MQSMLGERCMSKLIWIYGERGTGKTSLLLELKMLRPEIACFDEDIVRAVLYPQLECSTGGHLSHIRILTELACQAARYGADSVMATETPTYALRNLAHQRAKALGVECRLVHRMEFSNNPLIAASKIAEKWLKRVPRQLFIGRWQPFHEGHQKIIREALENGPVAIGVRQTLISSQENPEDCFMRMARIREEFKDDNVEVFICPDIDSIHIGRDVGYKIVQHEAVPGISGAELRKHSAT